MLLAKPASAPLQQPRPGCPFSPETGVGEEMPSGEEQTGVCQGRDGKGGNALGTVCRGPAELPSAALQTTPPCTQMQEGREQLSITGWGDADDSPDFIHSTAETPAFPLPRTSGEQARRGREGWRDAHRHRCRGWLTSRCLCWGCRGAREIKLGLCSPRRVWGKAPLQSHKGVACE